MTGDETEKQADRHTHSYIKKKTNNMNFFFVCVYWCAGLLLNTQVKIN